MSKGDTKEAMTSYDLLDIHGNYDKNRGFVGAIGGQFMQVVLIVQNLHNEFAKGTNEKAKSFFNLPNVTNFLIQYLKDMKNDNVQICVSNDTVNLLTELKASLNIEAISKMSEEAMAKFKLALSEQMQKVWNEV